jgi:hypothetical protein
MLSWQRALFAWEAQAILSGIADVLSVELHPAGTAERLQKLEACRAEPAATQPTPTPDPEWSEPVSQMSWERCRAVAELLGASLTTYRQCNGGYNCRLVPLRSTSSDIDMASGSWSTEIIAAQCGLMEVAQRIGRLDRHDHATGHINLAGLEVHQ